MRPRPAGAVRVPAHNSIDIHPPGNNRCPRSTDRTVDPFDIINRLGDYRKLET
jgi:hypothetical protein